MRSFLFGIILAFSLSWGLLPFVQAQGPENGELFTKEDLRKGEHPYPSLEKVQRVFREHHYIGELRELDAYLRFEKKKEGWKVAVIEHPWKEEKKELHRALFWSAESGNFRRLSLNGIEGGKTYQEFLRKRSFHTREQSHLLYEILPFYGFPEWETETIDQLERKGDLSDSLAFALGLAYNSRASEILRDTLSFPLIDHPLGASQKKLELGTMYWYELYRQRADDLFTFVQARSPEFESYVGRISIFRDHKVMRSFLDLFYQKGLDRAEEELEDDLYTPLIRSIAKNNLRSCDSNAVLLTYGDLNIFPLLYMQFHHGIRPDVKIIFQGLLDIPSYIKTVQKDPTSSDSLEFDISQAHLPDLSESYVQVKPAEDPIENRNELLDLETWLDSLDGVIAKQKGSVRIRSSLPNAFKLCLGEDTLIRKDTSSSFISFEDLMLLDLLADAQKGRSVHTTIGFPESHIYDLDEEMDPIGSVYHLHTVEKKGDFDFDGEERTYKLYTDSFVWEGFDRIDGEQERFLLSNRLWVLSRIISNIRDHGKNHRGEDLIELISERYLQDSSIFALYEENGILKPLRGIIWDAYYFDMDRLGDRLALQVLYGTRRQGSTFSRDHREYILEKLWYTLDHYDRYKVKKKFRESEKP